MDWKKQLRADPIPWLLEESDPGPRYLAMRDLLDYPADDPLLIAARKKAHADGPIAHILDQMNPQGFWVKPGAGYGPKYRSAVWSLIFLSQLGADIHTDKRIETACNYYLDHAMTTNGQISYNGSPSGTFDCLQGNMLAALLDLGFNDPRLAKGFDWMARSNTGEGVAPVEDRKAPLRFSAAKCAPNFACGANSEHPCAWGAVKALLAFSRLPSDRRTLQIEKAIHLGVEFLLAKDPARAEYPTWDGRPTSRDWWLFGFPLFYITDLLQLCEALVSLGYGRDARMKNVLDLVRSKQNDSGQWLLEYDYKGKTWVDFGRKKTPSKWVTIRALRVLKKM